MYEHVLTAFRTGVTDITLSLNHDAITTTHDHPPSSNTLQYNPHAVSLTVTFAVTTTTQASITVSGDGSITPAFGGTGTRTHELIPYVLLATQLGSLLFAHTVDWNYHTLFSPDR